jgi:manganese efflux pump family protein
MGLLEILLLAVGLAMDCFAVSLGIGTTRQACTPRPIFRLAFHFGLFQSLMPLLGWFGGSRVAYLIGGVDHWIAFVLLGWVGGRMIRSGVDHDAESYACDPSRGRTLVLLSIATSLDALAVGLSLAMLRVDILPPVLMIGVITALISVLGLRLGSRLGEAFGKRTEIVGGVILIGIGLRVLMGHLLG